MGRRPDLRPASRRKHDYDIHKQPVLPGPELGDEPGAMDDTARTRKTGQRVAKPRAGNGRKVENGKLEFGANQLHPGYPRFRYRSIPHSIRNAPRRYYPARAFVGKVKDRVTLLARWVWYNWIYGGKL